MSDDISSQVTDGILNAFGMMGLCAIGILLMVWLWWLIIPLAVLGLVIWGLAKLMKALTLTFVEWVIWAGVVCLCILLGYVIAGRDGAIIVGSLCTSGVVIWLMHRWSDRLSKSGK